MTWAGCKGRGDGPISPETGLPGVLSISAMPRLNPFPTTPEEYVDLAVAAFELAYDAGARGQMSTFTWAALEPDQGGYDSTKFGELNGAILNAANHGMVSLLGIQLINTTARELPADLGAAAFDDPIVMARFHALLDQILTPENCERISYLSIGNEVDAYLRAHPTEWDHYKAFYNDAVQYVHGIDPDIKVGVTGTFDGAVLQSPSELLSLNDMSDVIILTYYPLEADGEGMITARDPDDVSDDFTQMLSVAGEKKLILQEVGYPASETNLSSEAMQAEFVHHVFSAWKTAGARIPFLNFFLLHDFTQSMCDGFGGYYGLPGNTSFKTFLCSLGLRKDDGTARLAWGTLLDEAAEMGLPGK